MKTLKITLILFFVASLSAHAQHTNNGATLTIQSGLTIYSNNSFVNSGTINMNAGTLNLTGNWTNNATFNSSTSTVNLTGGSQSLGGSSVTTFFNLNLSGSGIKSLSNSQNVSGTLALNSLELNTNGNIISVTSPNLSAITTSTGFVSSTAGGALARATNTTVSYLFPVGATGGVRYRPVEVTPNDANASTFSVRMANLNATSEGYNLATVAGGISGLNSTYFHIVNRVAGSSPANITFYQSTDGFTKVARWPGSNWQQQPASAFQDRVTAVGITSFSPFVMFTTGGDSALEIPTLSEWGLIILSLLTLTLVAVFLSKKELALAGTSVSRSSGLSDLILNAPFEKTGYFKILRISLPIAIAGFALIHIFVGTNGVLDLTGTVVSTLIVSYLAYLYKFGFDQRES